MGDLGQVVEVEAEVVRPGARLGTPVLDDLHVLGARGLLGVADRLASAGEERFDRLAAGGVERPVFPGRCDDRAPAAGGPRIAEADLRDRLLELARLVLRADDVECVVLEHADAHACSPGLGASGFETAVLALAPVRDGLGGPREPLTRERAIDDRGDPPGRDGVLPQLEQPGAHRSA